jgi:hypothetical protein
MIATAGGNYAVPAFRPAASSRSAVATSSRIPNATPQAVPHEAAMVSYLDCGVRARAACDRRAAGNALVRCTS